MESLLLSRGHTTELLRDMPRRKRRSKSAPATVGRQPQRGGKRKQWSNTSMQAAMKAVSDDGMSINKAAVLHGVPKTTLKDRLSGRVVHGTNPGPAKYLDEEEEHALADHLIVSAKAGYGKTRKQVKAIVGNVAREKNVLRSHRVSDGWWRRFLERQPQLTLRKGDPTAHVRMNAVTKDVIEGYYNLLEETLCEHDLTNKPSHIYNMDESGMPLDHRPPNVVAKRGQKKVRYRVAGKKEQITILGCANAAGQALPPMVIFEGKHLNYQWTLGEVPGTYYGMSGKGWTDQELFRHWLKDHFVPNAVPGRPLLLILDGHSSHYEPVSIELAREEKIILFCLPPHTTQDSQPLDCTVFGPLKRHWSGVCHDFQQAHPGMVISKLNFSKLFAEAWLRAVTPANIIAGFRKCGIYPFNRNAIPILEEVQHIDVDAEDELKHDGMDDEPRDNEVEEQQFTYDQISLFQRRYEEGFDVFEDQDYVTWLRLNHPEAVPSDHSSLRAPTSVLDEFSDISPLDEIQLSVMESSTSMSALNLPTVSSVMEPSTSTSALPLSRLSWSLLLVCLP